MKKTILPLLSALTLCLVLLLPQKTLAQQAQAVGTLELQYGVIVVHSQKEIKTLNTPGQKVEVFEQDEIQTANATLGTLLLEPTLDLIKIHSQSLLKLEHIEKAKRNLSLPLGKAEFKLQNENNADASWEFSVRISKVLVFSEADLLSTQGSHFVLQTQGENVQLLTLEGHILFAQVNNLDNGVEVYSQQMSSIQGKKKASEPLDVPTQIIQQIVQSDSGSQWETFKETIQLKAPKSPPVVVVQEEPNIMEQYDVFSVELQQYKDSSIRSKNVLGQANVFSVQISQ